MPAPKYVEPYLQGIAGPDEMHGLGGDCMSPFCNYEFQPEDEAESYGGLLNCPQCGFANDLKEMYKSVGKPGGTTIAGLSLKEMGDIGQTVVLRLGELPNVGAINPAGQTYHHPIDVVVQGNGTAYGCEVKTNHSTAQERFKVGGRDERMQKIQYCMQNGLKPALIGVRLNFFTSLAYVFFREGLTDTWMGNSQMQHVGTYNFDDLNPFRSQDPKAQAMAVENANLPDQADEDEFGGVFGRNLSDELEQFRRELDYALSTPYSHLVKQGFDQDQPRDDKGQFTFKYDHKEIKIQDDKGKHTHNVRRCLHCGHLNATPTEYLGRIACSTCGNDPDRDFKLAKIVLSTKEADQVAKEMGFNYWGRLANGHRKYTMMDPNGTNHTVVVGSGAHGKNAAEIDASMARQRMTNCVNGQCYHITTPALPEQVEEEPFVVRAGMTVSLNGQEKFVSEIDGGIALVFDVQTGNEDIVPVHDLKAAGWIFDSSIGSYEWPQEASVSSQEPRYALQTSNPDPDYLFVYYMSELHVVPFEGIRRFETMLEALMNRFGDTMDKIHGGPDPTDVAAGEVFVKNKIEIRHLQLCEPEIRDYAEKAIKDWWKTQKSKAEWQADDGWHTLD